MLGPELAVSILTGFDVPEGLFGLGGTKVIVRAGRSSDTFSNSSPVYKGEIQQLSGGFAFNKQLSDVTGVSVETPVDAFKCERHTNSNEKELAFACEPRR